MLERRAGTRLSRADPKGTNGKKVPAHNCGLTLSSNLDSKRDGHWKQRPGPQHFPSHSWFLLIFLAGHRFLPVFWVIRSEQMPPPFLALLLCSLAVAGGNRLD